MLKIVVCCGGALPVLFNRGQKRAATATEQHGQADAECLLMSEGGPGRNCKPRPFAQPIRVSRENTDKTSQNS